MFDQARITAAIEMQRRSFALLKWVQDALRGGGLSFAVVHQTTDSAAAASEWMERNLANIPADARPAREEVPAFARLFTSYLTTSYTLSASTKRTVSYCGCYCSWCTYLRSSPDLIARSPTNKDVRAAKELKRLYLGDLAVEADVVDPLQAVERVVESSALHESVALCTWTTELLRRMEFASQGEAVLSLWREFAWKDGRAEKEIPASARIGAYGRATGDRGPSRA